MKPFFWALPVILSAVAIAQTPCKVQFSFVFKDDLNNFKQGFTKDTEKWFAKKIANKYPDVCYSSNAQPLVLFVRAEPATYHGTRTVSNQGTITDSDTGQTVARTQTDQTVPVTVPYHVLYLSIERKEAGDKWIVLHNFRGQTLHPTMYGICTHNCSPQRHLVESAVKWIHDGGLTDPTQSTLNPAETEVADPK